MRNLARNCLRSRTFSRWFAGLAGLVALGLTLASCGRGTSGGSSGTGAGIGSGTGSITVNLTDPPTCAFPNGDFDHVYVTIRSVQANLSASAGDNDSGWQELAPQLNSAPVQIDLFSLGSLGSNACLLATLGSASLPAGTYQQIRLLLVANSGATGPLPKVNNCAGQGFNCVVLHAGGSVQELHLSSEANTGLKIPPGQIVGGPISVGAGQDIDLNIDFNSCASVVREGNGKYRLKPALTAGQVSPNDTGISGRIVDAATSAPISTGTTGAVLVALEQPDSTGTDVIFRETVADSSGNFNFCPLPAGATFDVVAVAVNGNVAAYNATIAANVPGGANLGSIPLTTETTSPNTPTVFQGVITASGGASIDVAVSALQTINLPNVGGRMVTIPAEEGGNSTSTIAVDSKTSCPSSAPANANCASYTLIEPASNPRFGVFTAGSITYSNPLSGPVPYTIRADATVPLSGGTPACMLASEIKQLNANGTALLALPGAIVNVKEIDFSGCS